MTHHDLLAAARARIARAILGDVDLAGVPRTLGDVELRPHQREAVARLRRTIADLGGALLADDAGLGKTYVALALAAEARRPLLVLPSALGSTWRAAMDRAGVRVPVRTHESLSRAADDADADADADATHDLVIVDEAHQARTRETRRWRALARLTRGARVLLLTATPVHNARRELESLLALFLGARAHDAPDALLARCIVRRERDDAVVSRGALALPVVHPVRVLPLSHDDPVLDALAELPPPLGEADDAGTAALLAHGLVRQWASSEGALRSALTRRLARAEGLEAALREGCRPERAELARWAIADDAIQLPFAALLAPPEPRAAELLPALRRHVLALQDVLARLEVGVGRDVERAERLLQLRERHDGERIVAFTSFAGTVRALWRLLRGQPRVAALTSRGGMVAGGAVSREHVLRRFAPLAHGDEGVPPHEQVSLLVTTDLASEGVNLQDAAVVVHLDMPWTPARLEQRVGRVARMGVRRDGGVHVYAMAPPASAERVLAVEARLRAKLAAAARAVGVAGAIVPAIGFAGGASPPPTPESAPRLMERTRERLAAWLAPEPAGDDGVPLVAAVGARDGGDRALALVRLDGEMRLVAVETGVATDDAAAVARLVRAVDEGEATGAPATAVRVMRRRLAAWLRARRAASSAAVEEIGAAMLRRRAASAAAATLARAPRHERGHAGEVAQRLVRAAVDARGAGDEQAVAALLAAGGVPPAPGARRGEEARDDALLALVLVLPRP